VEDGSTNRRCGGGLSAYYCIPTSSNHVCFSDLCNPAARPQTSYLLMAAIFVVVAVVRHIR